MKNRWLIVSFVFIGLIGCAKTGSKNTSVTYKNLNIVQIITDAGFQVQDITEGMMTRKIEGEDTHNTASGLSRKRQCGSFTAKPSSNACFTVFEAVKKYIETSATPRGGTGLEAPFPYPKSAEQLKKPIHLALRYNDEERHGEFDFWLFPNEDETKVDFVLYLFEHPNPK